MESLYRDNDESLTNDGVAIDEEIAPTIIAIFKKYGETCKLRELAMLIHSIVDETLLSSIVKKKIAQRKKSISAEKQIVYAEDIIETIKIIIQKLENGKVLFECKELGDRFAEIDVSGRRVTICNDASVSSGDWFHITLEVADGSRQAAKDVLESLFGVPETTFDTIDSWRLPGDKHINLASNMIMVFEKRN